MNQKNKITLHHDDPQPLATSNQPPRRGFDPPILNLSPRQIKALELIMAGKSTKEIIQGSGASRTTLWRWRTSDPNFIAALNQWRAEVQKNTRDRILALGTEAADAVVRALADKSARIGMKLLG